MNGDILSQYRSSENAINNIIEQINSNQRGVTKWQESVLQEVNVVNETLNLFKIILLKSESDQQLQSPTSVHKQSYSDIAKQSTGQTKSVVMLSPKDPNQVKDSEQSLQLVRRMVNKVTVGVKNIRIVRNKGVILNLEMNLNVTNWLNLWKKTRIFQLEYPRSGTSAHYPRDRE
ncbi:hypothetical protein ANN_03927 [Periplaneta americana]|uniref:Uncharacterized protein n=1 Tax=Periplaneta americana TaxID=6978 RepID=A0ABQ8T8C3_PERAM|nr:hypothetical protein ANN_03927 [Periplaneta americana]